MVSLESIQSPSRSMEPNSSPRISFSAEFLDDSNFISITPNSPRRREIERAQKKPASGLEFEFLSGNNNVSSPNMITADELFSEGKLLPFWQMQHAEKLNKINLKMKDNEEDEEEASKEESRVSWFMDEDPSPRPPKCTVLWKELLRLRKQRNSTLSPSSSSSSSASSTSSLADIASADQGSHKEGSREKGVRKGLQRTTSATLRIRPMINVPLCTKAKTSSLPPLFPLKKGKLER